MVSGIKEGNQTSLDINLFHQKLGHANKPTTLKTAQDLNINLINNWVPCIACALDKANQKKLNKTNTKKSTIPGERYYTDISYISGSSLGGKRYWILMVDKATRFKLSGVFKVKYDMAAFVVGTIKTLVNQDYKVKYI